MTPEVLAKTTANPEDALNGIKRLLDIRPDLEADMDRLLPFAHIFSGSGFLSDWLIAKPEEIDWLLDKGRFDSTTDENSLSANLKELMAKRDAMSALRRFKHRELCRICARELAGLASFEETASDWSTVADVAIDAAIKIAESAALEKYGDPVYTELTDDKERIGRFAALGLGKLGGRELNISSDVDLIFIHSSDNGTTRGQDSIQLHEFFVRIAREVVRLINDVTEEGFVFRVDLDLRPEGKAGEITNSIGAMEIYYESWGQQWERQALIKARHCGGGREVSEEVLYRLHPFVYRKYMDESDLKEIAAMKGKIDQALKGSKGSRDIVYDIKLGRGGIREIEFVVQALQLLYGARHSDLQTQSTIKALDICDFLGFLSTPHYKDLKDTYYFHRKLENRIQYERNQQTHKIPKDKLRKEKLGRLMGFDNGDPAGHLMDDIKKRMKRIREIFDLFFIQEEKTGSETFPSPLDDEEAVAAWLDSLKFDHPETSAKALNLLRNGSSFSHPSERSVMAFDRFGPYIVSQAAVTPWPDHVILGFSNFVESRGGRDLLYELFDEHRPVIKLLAAIFSSSEYLTAVLLRQPDLLDRLLVSDPVGKPAAREAYALEFKQDVSQKSSVESRLGLINSFRAAESLRLGLRRILGLSDRFEQMNGLTLLAEEYIKAVTGLAREEVDKTHGTPDDVKWVLVAAGKLGRREMNFGSDIDLLVFYENNDGGAGAASVYDYVILLVQSLIRLSGTMTPLGDGYQIDMRLRPEGDAGPLVVSYNAMVDYYNNRGQVWERLALVGARSISGDEKFGRKVMATLGSFIKPGELLLKPSDSDKIIKIRERIASEKVKPGVVDIKFGRGGLIEIEFICQWLTMENRESPKGDKPFTLSVLKTAHEKGWLDKNVADDLIKAYLFFRSLEDTLRMDKEQAVNVIPVSDTILLNRLSRAVEETPGGKRKLVEIIKETMRKVQDIYLRFFESRAKIK